MSRRQPQGYHQSALWRLFDSVAERLDRKAGWHRLPLPLPTVELPPPGPGLPGIRVGG